MSNPNVKLIKIIFLIAEEGLTGLNIPGDEWCIKNANIAVEIIYGNASILNHYIFYISYLFAISYIDPINIDKIVK